MKLVMQSKMSIVELAYLEVLTVEVSPTQKNCTIRSPVAILVTNFKLSFSARQVKFNLHD